MTLLQEFGAVRQPEIEIKGKKHEFCIFFTVLLNAAIILYSEHMLLLGVVSGNFDARSLQLQRRFPAERLLRDELGRLLVLEERQATVTGHAVNLQVEKERKEKWG